MDRIVVIGRPGGGKSTLAAELGPLLDMPVFHLDRLFWRPGWRKTPRDEFTRIQRKIMAENERWIIDGNYTSTLCTRLSRCDCVIYLDFPPLTCAVRVTARTLRGWLHGERRPDMAAGCVQRPFSRHFLEFLVYTCRFPSAGRIEDMLGDLGEEVTLFRLRSPGQLGQLRRDVRQMTENLRRSR